MPLLQPNTFVYTKNHDQDQQRLEIKNVYESISFKLPGGLSFMCPSSGGFFMAVESINKFRNNNFFGIEMTQQTIIELDTNPVKRATGRPKGSSSKITIDRLLDAIDIQCGKNFAELLAEGYHATILDNDKRLRLEYERMFLGKVVADRVSLDVNESEEAVAAKKLAFADAVRQLTGIAQADADRNIIDVASIEKNDHK